MRLDEIYAEKQIAGETALEKKSELASSRERIRAATELFEQNFKDNGKPKTEEGKRLYKMYRTGSYWYPRFLKRLYNRLKYKLQNVFS